MPAGMGHPHLLGQPVQCVTTLWVKSFFLIPPLSQFKTIPPCPITVHPHKQPFPLLFIHSLQVLEGHNEVSLQPSLLQAKQTQFPQPFDAGLYSAGGFHTAESWPTLHILSGYLHPMSHSPPCACLEATFPPPWHLPVPHQNRSHSAYQTSSALIAVRSSLDMHFPRDFLFSTALRGFSYLHILKITARVQLLQGLEPASVHPESRGCLLCVLHMPRACLLFAAKRGHEPEHRCPARKKQSLPTDGDRLLKASPAAAH